MSSLRPDDAPTPGFQFSMKTLLVVVTVAPLLIAQIVWCGASGFFNTYTGVAIAAVVLPLTAGLGILIWLYARYGGRKSVATGDLYEVLWWTAVVLLVLGIGAISLATVLIPAPIMLLAFAWAYSRYWFTCQSSLLWMLVVAVEHEMPLASALAAFADDCRGRFGHHARRLASMLYEGAPLPYALEQLPALLSANELFAVRVGHETGALCGVLRDSADRRTSAQPLWQAISARLGYLVMVVVVMQSMLAFMLLKIIPAFEKMLEDFEANVPAVTQLVIQVADWFAGSPLGVLIVVLGFLGTIALYIALLAYYLGRVDFNLPFVTRLDSSAVLRALALIVHKEQSPAAMLGSLARHYPKIAVRRRLEAVCADVERGAEWCESLRRNRLIREAEAAAFEAAQRVGNLAWVLREMAESAERRLGYRLQAWLNVLFPLALAALGGLVAVLVVGFFLPLINILQRLM